MPDSAALPTVVSGLPPFCLNAVQALLAVLLGDQALDQIAEKYLLHRGYFIRRKLKFRPRRDRADFVSYLDFNHRHIDILGFHPLLQGAVRVVAICCRNGFGDFNPQAELNVIVGKRIISGRERWQAFRELVKPKWSEAFRDAIHEQTGAQEFTHITAVPRLSGDRLSWETHSPFQAALGGNPVRVIDLADMLR